MITNDLSKGIMFFDDCESAPKANWGGDYTKEYSMFTGGNQDFNNPDPRAGIYLVSDQARVGAKCYLLTMEKRTDYPACCNWVRSELAWMDNNHVNNPDNVWRFAAASIMFHPSMDFGGTQRFQILYDHKESPDDSNTKFWLGLRGNKFIVDGQHVGGETELDFEPKTGVWYDFLLDRTWGNNATIKLYCNKAIVYQKTGNFHTNQSPFSRLQQGFYIWPWASANGQNEGAGNAADAKPKKMYIDQIKMGNPSANINDFFIDGGGVIDPGPEPEKPTANAGPDFYLPLGNTGVLRGTTTNASTKTWSKASGPGTVTYATPNADTTNVTFSAEGTYVNKLTAGAVSDQATTFVVRANAGQDKTAVAGETITLTGSSTSGVPVSKVEWLEGTTVISTENEVDVKKDTPGTAVLTFRVTSPSTLVVSDSVNVVFTEKIPEPPKDIFIDKVETDVIDGNLVAIITYLDGTKTTIDKKE